ncbi:MAG TPA: hypothetical protein VLT32_00920 [Candidatus Sulfomarinibacteraceae bacterium]|nr:hypothetical protein [Candidatus Sulfomarinibacteraceae bacterium]
MAASSTDREPRPEDFGLSGADVARAPEPVTTRCRPLIVVGLWVLILAAAFVIILVATGSAAAALVFSVVTVGAASIVLVPLLVCVVCASERAETRWLCRRVPVYEACLAYRAALDAFRRGKLRQEAAEADHGRWLELGPAALRAEVARQLEAAGAVVEPVPDRELAGYDLAVEAGGGETVLVRCEPAARPVAIGVGRELAACLAETGADRAVVVTVAPPSPQLAAYLAGRPLAVVAPWALSEAPSAPD